MVLLRCVGGQQFLAAARLRHIGNTQWGARCHLDPKRFAEACAQEQTGW